MDQKEEERAVEEYLQARDMQERGKDELSSEETDKKRNFIKLHVAEYYGGDEEILQLFTEHFLRYLQENKGIKTEEHNLELLNMHELQTIVQAFHEKHPKSESRKVVEPLPEQPINCQALHIPNSSEAWKLKKVYYSNGAWDYELKGYQECRKEKPFFLEIKNHKNIVIIFNSNHTKKRGGFFGIGGTLELWIEIRSNAFKDTVERTVQDFVFLRKALRRLFPFTYIPPLDISDKDISKIDNESIKNKVMNECRRFINAVCKNQQLLENVYTFRFFRQLKYQNYIEHKKRVDQFMINHVKLLRNPEGCVPIEISDDNQTLKKDYSRKSELLQKMWRNIDDSNAKIVQKFKQIKGEINYQTRQFQLVLTDIVNSNQHLLSECYQKLSNILLCYSDVYKVYHDNLDQSQEFFESISLQVASQSQNNWRSFSNYKTEVSEFHQEYQIRRKVFLEKELNQEKKEKYCKSTITNSSLESSPVSNPNMSVILEMGLENNDEREFAWIQRYSKWKAYINKQFTLSFERLVDNDRDILTKILQEKTQKVLESNKREEQSFISYLSVLHQ